MDKRSTNSIPLLGNFRNWCIKEHKKGTANNYCTYLKNIPNDIGICQSDPYYDYLKVIGTLVHDGFIVFAKIVLTKMMEKLEDYISKNGLTTTLSNDRSAMQSYREFLLSEAQFISASNIICIGNNYSTNINLKNFNLTKRNCEIDSMQYILHVIGVKNFIKLSIESCLLFHEDIVTDRFSEILAAHGLINPNPLDARWSNDSYIYTNKTFSASNNFMKEFQDGSYLHDVIINGGPKGSRKKDENCEVRRLINKYTGYTIGAKQIIKNYVISHVWGNASDPRYFTNFWNIVLVPSWADFLLPKNNSPIIGTISSQLTSTIMTICDQLYASTNLNWAGLGLSKPAIVNPKNVIHGDYNIHIMCKKSTKNSVGKIDMKQIKI